VKGYVQLRRGLYDHIPLMADSEVVIYVALVMLGRINDGTVSMTLRDLASDLHKSPARISAALKRLAEPHGADNVRYITYEPARNQHDMTRIRILKWRKSAVTVSDTAPVTATGQQADSKRTASGQHTGSDLPKAGPQEGRRRLEKVGDKTNGRFSADETAAGQQALYDKKPPKCGTCLDTGMDPLTDKPCDCKAGDYYRKEASWSRSTPSASCPTSTTRL
jgi:hypothetical protein